MCTLSCLHGHWVDKVCHVIDERVRQNHKAPKENLISRGSKIQIEEMKMIRPFLHPNQNSKGSLHGLTVMADLGESIYSL